MDWTHKKVAIGLLGCALVTMGAWWIVSPKQLAVTNMQSAPIQSAQAPSPQLDFTAGNLTVNQATSQALSPTAGNQIADQPAMDDEFSRFLASLPDMQQQQYRWLNSQLFDLLAFSTKQERAQWQAQGFPVPEDFTLIERYPVQELGQQLFNRVAPAEWTTRSNPAMAASTFRALGALKTLQQLETVIKYYQPDYDLLSNSRKPASFANSVPEQVQAALQQVVLAQAVLRNDSAIESLVRVKFELMLAEWHASGAAAEPLSVLAVAALANASVKLSGGHVAAWVSARYPTDLPALQQAIAQQQAVAQ